MFVRSFQRVDRALARSPAALRLSLPHVKCPMPKRTTSRSAPAIDRPLAAAHRKGGLFCGCLRVLPMGSASHNLCRGDRDDRPMENNPLLRWIRLAQVGAADLSVCLGAGVGLKLCARWLGGKNQAGGDTKIPKGYPLYRFISSHAPVVPSKNLFENGGVHFAPCEEVQTSC